MHVHLLISWQTSCTVNGGLIEQEWSRNNPAEDCWIFSINSWKVPETDSRFFQSSLTFKSQSHLITSKSSLQLNTHTYTVQASPTTSMTLPQNSRQYGLWGKIHPNIWPNYNDLTLLPHWESWLDWGKWFTFMAQQFRLVNYGNLPKSSILIGFSMKSTIQNRGYP